MKKAPNFLHVESQRRGQPNASERKTMNDSLTTRNNLLTVISPTELGPYQNLQDTVAEPSHTGKRLPCLER